MVVSLEKMVRRDTDELVSIQLNNATGPEMWTIVLDSFADSCTRVEARLQDRANRFGVAEDEVKESVGLLRRNAWETFRRRVGDELSDNLVLVKLRTRLEDKFRYDEKTGLPRVWKPEDDMDPVYTKANEEALALLPVFAKITNEGSKLENLDAFFVYDSDFDYAESLVIHSPAKMQDITTRFRREAEATFLEAKRSLVATQAKVPYWMMVLLVVLGWNEFTTILFNPVYLVLFTFFGFVGYVIWFLNLTGPVEQVARGIANQIMVIVQAKVTEASQPRKPGVRDGGPVEEFEMRKRN